MIKVFIRKCRSAAFYSRQWLEQRRLAAEQRTRKNAFSNWIRRLELTRPDILIGANFVAMGGTRQHMHSLSLYSKHSTALMPDEECLKVLTPWHLATEFSQQFSNWRPKSVVAVHSHVFPWFIDWCMDQKNRYGTRWVHTHHNWYYPEFGRDGLEPWQQQFNEHFLIALRNADVCLTVSRGQQNFLSSTFGITAEYLPNGVDVEACDKGLPERWVRRTGISDAILYVGRNDPVKNPAAFVKLAESLPAERFVMVGEGLSKDVLRNEWNVVPPENLLVLGKMSHAEVQDAIAASCVVVMTSRREGLPTLALEAMAHGKPIVVPDEEGCMEAISHGEFGFIYQQDNISELAERTMQAKGDLIRCSGSRERVLSEFSWPVIVSKLDEIYSGHR